MNGNFDWRRLRSREKMPWYAHGYFHAAGIDPRYSRRIYVFKRQFNGASRLPIYFMRQLRGCISAEHRPRAVARWRDDHDEIVTHWNRNLYDTGCIRWKCQCVQGARPQDPQDNDRIDHRHPERQPAQRHPRQHRPARQRPALRVLRGTLETPGLPVPRQRPRWITTSSLCQLSGLTGNLALPAAAGEKTGTAS